MKTLNSDTKSTVVRLPEDDSKHSCWYAHKDVANSWVVGVKHPDGQKDEYSIKINNIPDEMFVVNLIAQFRDGGQKAVDSWLLNGCP